VHHRQKMFITSLLAASLFSVSQTLWAQQDHSGDGAMQHGEQGSGGMMNHEGGDGMGGGMMMEHMQQMHTNLHSGDSNSGQGAFDLIKQVVNQLESNPDTDWSKVNIELLREHLVDMNQLTLYAEVEASEVEGGNRYVVTGDGITREAIKRMVPMHAAQIQTELSGWNAATETRRNGVVLTVSSDNPATVAKIRGLGFMGFMVLGEHHTDHHIMMATGQSHDDMSGTARDQSHSH
jgi:hypothetical protein